MSAHLLDVNVLVALAWPTHVHHAASRAWFRGEDSRAWASCAITETGFLRVSANERAVGEPVSVAQATELLAALRGHGDHRFLADDVSPTGDTHVAPAAVHGHRQVTDAHLLDLAARHDIRVATLDRRMTALDRDGSHLTVIEVD